MKRQNVLNEEKDSFSRPKFVPYLISSPLGNHGVFFGSIISSQLSRSSGFLSKGEDEASSICDSPIQRWIDHACGSPF
jgi:hypothetical protein